MGGCLSRVSSRSSRPLRWLTRLDSTFPVRAGSGQRLSKKEWSDADSTNPPRRRCRVGLPRLAHSITDGRGRRVIASGTNPPFVRLDDLNDRLLGTATQIDAVGGTFHPGTAAPRGAGTFLNFQFLENGRYLVICMNRAHSLNDWMFGFVNVVNHHHHDDDDHDRPGHDGHDHE